MPYKILLVEDEESLRKVYVEYLTTNGDDFEILEAADGEEAIKVIDENLDLDFVLLDILLPKKDGLKVLAELKDDEKYEGIIIYIATVLNDDKVIKEGFELGADGYIIKDTLNPEELKEEILSALKEKEEETKAPDLST